MYQCWQGLKIRIIKKCHIASLVTIWSLKNRLSRPRNLQISLMRCHLFLTWTFLRPAMAILNFNEQRLFHTEEFFSLNSATVCNQQNLERFWRWLSTLHFEMKWQWGKWGYYESLKYYCFWSDVSLWHLKIWRICRWTLATIVSLSTVGQFLMLWWNRN